MSRYKRWQAIARRLARCSNDADDLLQEALLAAVLAGRKPLDNASDAPWFRGVLANLAAMQARSAVRERRRREAVVPDGNSVISDLDPVSDEILRDLPDGLRRVLVLALCGLDRAEIRQVLDLSDDALRQRLGGLRKRLQSSSTTDGSALAAAYAARLARNNAPDTGKRRAVLARGPVRLPGFRFGVSDADGNLIAVHSEQPSQKVPARQQTNEPDRQQGDPEPGETSD